MRCKGGSPYTVPRKVDFEIPPVLPAKEVGEVAVEPSASPKKEVVKKADLPAEKASEKVSEPCDMTLLEQKREGIYDEFQSETDYTSYYSSEPEYMEIHEGPAHNRRVRLQKKKVKGPHSKRTRKMKSPAQCEARKRRKDARRDRDLNGIAPQQPSKPSEKKSNKRGAQEDVHSEKNDDKKRRM